MKISAYERCVTGNARITVSLMKPKLIIFKEVTKMSVKDGIKFGIGFSIGLTLMHAFDTALGDIMDKTKKDDEKGGEEES